MHNFQSTMNNKLIINLMGTRIIASLLFFAILVSATPATFGRNVKIMTYNVHNGVGLDKKRDHRRIADVIDRQKPQFVAIQEVDSVTNRSGHTYVLGEIAEAAGMVPVYAPSIKFDGGLYGIGLLSKTAPDSVNRIHLPGREESRMLLVAHFKDCVVINTHLSLTPEDALASTEIIRNLLNSTGDKTVILMGDLNSLPDSPVIKALQRDFTIVSPVDTPTFPADRPTEQIDYVMIKSAKLFVVTRTEIIDEETASDHRPIAVQLVINDISRPYFMD